MSETIINGIDVSECDYFEKQHIEDMYESDDCNVCIDNFCALCWKECEKHNGCYFKQLQRLKKENNILRKTIKDKNIVGVCEQSNKYKQALENIKRFLIYADHSTTGDKYFENVERAFNIANEVLKDV